MGIETVQLVFTLTFDDIQIANAVYSSIKVEEESQPNRERARLHVEQDNEVVHIEVTASDLVAARAAANSVLKWAELAKKTIELSQSAGN